MSKIEGGKRGKYPLRFPSRISGKKVPIRDIESDIILFSNLSENLLPSLRVLSDSESSKGKILGYLNALAPNIRKTFESQTLLSLSDILLFLRVPLTHESSDVRAGTLRVLRHMIKSKDDVFTLLQLKLENLFIRSIDIDLGNAVERIQSLRVSRQILLLHPSALPKGILKALVALIDGAHPESKSENSSTLNSTSFSSSSSVSAALALLCEISVLNPEAFLSSNSVKILLRSILNTNKPRILQVILTCLLRLYNKPSHRRQVSFSLDFLFSPLTDFSSFSSFDNESESGKREVIVDSSLSALLFLLTSWSGLLSLYSSSLLKTLVSCLYLSQGSRLSERLLDVLSESLGYSVPKEPFSESFLDKSIENIPVFKDSWKLAEGFVVSEAFDLLPSLSQSRPNLLESHTVLLLSLLLHAQLPEALIHVLLFSESESSLASYKALHLLSQFLESLSTLHPTELLSHCLPSLLTQAFSSSIFRSSSLSKKTLRALELLSSLKKRGVVPCTLFLREILIHSERFQRAFWKKAPLSRLPSSSDSRLISDSQVLLSTQSETWNWNLIQLLLCHPTQQFLSHLDSSDSYRKFLRKLVEFYKPSVGAFGKMELNDGVVSKVANVGLDFLDFLILRASKSSAVMSLTTELLEDIHSVIKDALTASSESECFLSPTKIASTASMYYFLFLGHLSRSSSGRSLLSFHDILPSLSSLSRMRSDLYLKLTISALDYSSDSGCRFLFERILKEETSRESLKLYSIRFLGVLLRSQSPNTSQWSLQCLVSLLFDESSFSGSSSSLISYTVLNLLDEALDDKMNLESFLSALSLQRHRVSELFNGDFRRRLLLLRLLSSQNGFHFLNTLSPSFLSEESSRWLCRYNNQYVSHIETLLSEYLSHRSESRSRTHSSSSSFYFHSLEARNLVIPSHFAGQLSSSCQGLQYLKSQKSWSLEPALRLSEKCNSEDDSDILRLKASIWIICHIGSSVKGAELMQKTGSLELVISIAESSPLLSLRGHAFYALSLLAQNHFGIQVLSLHGWSSLRHRRGESWPLRVTLSEFYDSSYVKSSLELKDSFLSLSSFQIPTDKFSSYKSISHHHLYPPHLLLKVYGSLCRRKEKRRESKNKRRSFRQKISHRLSKLSDDIRSSLSHYSDVLSSEREFQERTSIVSDNSESFLKECEINEGSISSKDSFSNDSLVSQLLESSLPTHSEEEIQETDNAFKSEPYYWGLTLPNDLHKLLYVETPVSFPLLGSKDEPPNLEYRHDENQCFLSFHSPLQTENENTLGSRAEILKLLGRMIHFGTKTSEQGLLKIKEQSPNLFQNVCLYSDVCQLLSHYNYKLSVRRFIQELFLDIKFPEPNISSNLSENFTSELKEEKPFP